MAGSSVTVTVSPHIQMVGHGGVGEVLISLACLSDDTDGSIPDQDLGATQNLAGLKAYTLTEIITDPDATAYPTTAYRVKVIEKATSRRLFRGSARSAAGVSQAQSAHEDLGYFPSVDNTLTVKFLADDGDTEAAADVGNEKIVTVKLRFTKRDK